MEETKHLLLMFLLKTFHDRPKVVENTYQLIYNYNNGKKERDDYQKTLKSICDLVNGELPSEVLVYLLTLVDMPQNGGCHMPQMEKLQKSQPDLAGRVHAYLLENMNHKRVEDKAASSKVLQTDETVKVDSLEKNNCTASTAQVGAEKEEEIFVKPVPVKKGRIRKRSSKKKVEVEEAICDNIDRVKPLLDIASDYVIQNENHLKQMYKTKLARAWDMINSNKYGGDALNECYAAVKYLNDKVRLLRCIENECVEDDVLFELYGNSKVFTIDMIREPDPFLLSQEELQNIKNFVHNI